MSMNQLYHDRGVAKTRAAHASTNTQRDGYAAEARLVGERISEQQIDPKPVANVRDDHFIVFRAEEVQLTSTQFGGGDWHWRLTDKAGSTLVEGAGYHSESECLEAVAMLRDRGASAPVELSNS